MTFSIYGLIDPRDGSIFYIGRTGDLHRRTAAHCEGTDQLSGIQVRQIKAAGFLPHVVVLEHAATFEQSCVAEIFWIELLRTRGAALKNAQALAGYVAREEEREASAAQAIQMETRLTPNALKVLSDGGKLSKRRWSKRDEARLKGMVKAKMSPAAMADALGRSLTDVSFRLSAFDHQ